MKKLSIIIFLILVASIVTYSQTSIFVIPPIGALPEGKTLVLTKLNHLNFIDSPDAACERTQGSVSLLCRAAIMATVTKNSKILLRLPYSSYLYSISMPDLKALTPKERNPNPPPAWKLEVNNDDFKQTRSILGSVVSTDGRVSLSVVCDPIGVTGAEDFKRDLWLFINSSDYLGSSRGGNPVNQYDNTRDLYYIIDNDEPVRDRWVYDDKGAAKFFHTTNDGRREIGRFIDRLRKSERLRMKLYKYDYGSNEHAFDTRGFEKVYNRIYYECGKSWGK